MERIPNALIIPLIVNHFSPFDDFSNRLVLFVKTKMTANINVDTEPKTNVAKNGLGISDNPILIIGCIIPRAKEAPNGKSNTHNGQVLFKLFVLNADNNSPTVINNIPIINWKPQGSPSKKIAGPAAKKGANAPIAEVSAGPTRAIENT